MSDPDGVSPGLLNSFTNSQQTSELKEIAAGSHATLQTTLLDSSLFKIFNY